MGSAVGSNWFARYYASLSFSEHVTVGTAAIMLLMVLSMVALPEPSLSAMMLALCMVLVSLVSTVCLCYLVARQLLRMRWPDWPALVALVAGSVGALPVGTILYSMLAR